MSKSLITRIKFKSYSSYRYLSNNFDKEYSLAPKYPEILDVSEKAVTQRNKLTKHKKLEVLKTVEEKLFGINLEKYYGWKCLILKEGDYPYNILPFIQHVTRTTIKQLDRQQFHNVQQVNEDECKEILSYIRPYLQEALLFELKGKRSNIPDDSYFSNRTSDGYVEDGIGKSVIRQLNSIILNSLSIKYPHLLETMIDYDPRLEAFWSVGGFHPSEELIKIREDKELSDEEKNEKVEHWIQYFGRSSLQLRHQYPLSPLNTGSVEGFQDSDPFQNIPIMDHAPENSYGFNLERRFGTNIPGFWPGDKNEFGYLSFHHNGYLMDRPPSFGEDEHLKTCHAQAILASFGWLHAQACYQGFSTFSELTYPLTSQSVITNGRVFAFYLYQLNTTQLHSDHTKTNPRINVCFHLNPSLLYTEIQGSEFIGWNDDVILSLLSCYLNIPKERKDTNMKPYLGTKEKYLYEIEDVERREWLHNQFRHMYSNRPRHKLPYEIYDWERIYKIKFETRPIEARSRPFERDEDPLEERKYYEHMHAYIPKAQRSRRKHWTGWRAKFAKTYYPDL